MSYLKDFDYTNNTAIYVPAPEQQFIKQNQESGLIKGHFKKIAGLTAVAALLGAAVASSGVMQNPETLMSFG